jgi:hypothetical protein
VTLRLASHCVSVTTLVLVVSACASLNANRDDEQANGNQPQADAVVAPTNDSDRTADSTPTNTQDKEGEPQILGIRFGSWAEILTVVITAFAVGAAFGTLHKMEKQLSEMRSQAGDMKASIEQATRSAAAMESIALAMAGNLQLLKDALEINREIATTNREMVTHQRAILTVTAVQFGPSGPTREPTFVINLTNSGGKPATVTEYATMMWTEEPLPNPCDPTQLRWMPTSGVAAPEKTVAVKCGYTGERFTQDTWDRIHRGDFSISFHCVIRYETGFPGVIGETSIGVEYDHEMTGSPVHLRFVNTNLPGYNYVR